MMFRSIFQSCCVCVCLVYATGVCAGGWVRRHVDQVASSAVNAQSSLSHVTSDLGDAFAWVARSKYADSPMHRAFRLAEQNGQAVYLCRAPMGRSMYPGLTRGSHGVCSYLYNPCVAGCELTGQGGNQLRHRCINACEDRMVVGHRNHYDIYRMGKGESPVHWVKAAFGDIPEHAWKIGWGPYNHAQYICRVDYHNHWHLGVLRYVDHRGRSYHRGYCDGFDAIDHKNTRDFYHYEVLSLKSDRFAHVWF